MLGGASVAYATDENLIDDRFPRDLLAQFEADEPGCVQAALDNAAAVINTTLSARYALPVRNTDTLRTLRLCNAALARYELLSRRNMAHMSPDVIQDRAYWLSEWLRDVADGRRPVAIEEAGEDGEYTAIIVRATRYGAEDETRLPFFGMDKLKHF